VVLEGSKPEFGDTSDLLLVLFLLLIFLGSGLFVLVGINLFADGNFLISGFNLTDTRCSLRRLLSLLYLE